MAKSDKFVIVSNRLPVVVKKVNGKLVFKPGEGGLATGMSSVSKKSDSIWIGWPGISSDELSNSEKKQIISELKKYKCHPVFLSQKMIDEFYSGYCNATIWPLFHYFTTSTVYDNDYWESYRLVNRKFLAEVKKYAKVETKVWIHDYQLMLLPQMLRETVNKVLIGYFLHIPFPSYEIFRLLPEREEILKGLLGAELVGFHTYDYARHFISSVQRLLGNDNHLGKIIVDNRLVQVDAFPIGIDYDKFAKSNNAISEKLLPKRLVSPSSKEKIILAVDRADYSKGIPARLDAFEMFLEKNKQNIGKVKFVVVAVPSRDGVEMYQKLRETIEQKVSRINGRFSTDEWYPIHYRYQSVPFDELTGLYSKADVMLVTPLRDGMNLVAKEYVATNHKKHGVLVLSEMAGVASEFPEAIQVNPNSSVAVSDAIQQALVMPKAEQKERMQAMQGRISDYTINKWADDFMGELVKTRDINRRQKTMNRKSRRELINSYRKAERRLILLDYDGTLKSFTKSTSQKAALPSTKVRRIIKKLTADKNNKVAIVSGRPRAILESLFESSITLQLVAEHGAWILKAGRWVKYTAAPKKWKKKVQAVMEQFALRTPGSHVEVKDFSLVWHYRNVSPDLAYVRASELKRELYDVVYDSDVGVFDGQKIVEVKPRSMHKGAIATEFLAEEKWDFIMAIGDDFTDEDMFKALPERAYTIHVGHGETEAGYQLDAVDDVIDLLEDLNG